MRELINLQLKITIVRRFSFKNEETMKVMRLPDTIKNIKMISSILIMYLNRFIARFLFRVSSETN